MSNKSGTSAQAVSLPTGGGALSGIGETFSPELFTGTATCSVPLDLPPGRNGFQPELALSYSSGDGNGAFGLGWSVAVPSVSRKTSAGVPRYRQDEAGEEDAFVLAGAEDLVPVAEPDAGVRRFRPRTEGLFARIDRIAGTERSVWRVSTTDGLVSTFGAGADPAVVADPADPRHIFRWMLSDTVDPFGNRIDYDYLRDQGSDGPHEWDQLYPRRIRYLDYDSDGDDAEYLVSVTFGYEERPDPFSGHRAGFEIRTRLRCKRIEIRTHADTDRLLRSYELDYFDDLVERGEREASELPVNGVSLLCRVRLVGHDGERTEDLAPLELSYSRFEPHRRRFRPLAADQDALPDVSLADAALETVDLRGNGLPDLVRVDGGVQHWRNLGGGRFARPQALDEAPAAISLADPAVQFADMNGDGRADLLDLSRRGYFPLTSEGNWSSEGFVQYPATPALTMGAADLRLVDLDGDGVVDALRTGTDFELFFNHPRRGWNRVETRPRRPLAEFPDVTFADPRIKLADLNGDGLQDIVMVQDGRIDYWPYRGHGHWGRRLTMAGSPRFEDEPPIPFDPARVLCGDLDGDGLDDIVYVQTRRITCWINQGGERWSDPLTIEGTPAFAGIDGVRLADVLGNGMPGVLWTTIPTHQGVSHYQFLDLTDGHKPYLLHEVDNNLGAVTRLSHAPSTEFYLADESVPETRWKAPLPFPVHVLTRIDSIDEIAGTTLTSRLAYHDGYWDGVDREFRGFGLVEQYDAETLTEPASADRHVSPPVLAKTWFHQGPVGDGWKQVTERDRSAEFWPEDPPALGHVDAVNEFLAATPDAERRTALRTLRGSILRREVYSPDDTALASRPFTVTEYAYALRREESTDPEAAVRPRVFFPHQVAERATRWDRGHDPMTSVRFIGDYDAYGQPRRTVSIAVPRGRDFRQTATASEPYLATCATTRFAYRDEPGRYLVDRVVTTTDYELRNDGTASALGLPASMEAGTADDMAVIGQTLNYYDGEPFTGLPHGQVGDFGALVRSETLTFTEAMLREAYADAGEGTEPGIPPYLEPGETRWTEDHPHEFRSQLAPLAGYCFATEPGTERGFFAPTTRYRYDFHDSGGGRGLVTGMRDPRGAETAIQHDQYHAFPVRHTDPVALSTETEHDYRVLRPRRVTDVNGNRTAVAYTPLGLVERVAASGEPGEPAGDTLDDPGIRYHYDLAPAHDRDGHRKPASVRTVRRVHHVNDRDVPLPDRHQTLESVEYSDGFGRLLQTRGHAADLLFGDATFADATLPAEPADTDVQEPVAGRRDDDGSPPTVIVSGWQVYDNKGRVVETFDPFLAAGWEYTSPAEHQRRPRIAIRYDAAGRRVSTAYPDGSQERLVHGIPSDLADPDTVQPTPWEAYTYDRNDNADRTHPRLAHRHRQHRATPSSVVRDALGRAVARIERTRAVADEDDALAPVEELWTRSVLDIRGNLLRSIDELGRTACSHVYDLADRVLRTDSADGGTRRTLTDAAGAEIERRDAKGALILRAFDMLGRTSRVWARDDDAAQMTLRERTEYGDGGQPQQPAEDRSAARAANLLGRPRRHFDEAGVSTVLHVDFAGNERERTRQALSDDVILGHFTGPDGDGPEPAFRVDWTPPPGTSVTEHVSTLIDPVAHQVSTQVDALGRTTSLQCPAGANGKRRQLQFGYSHAGDLERILLDDAPVVEHIAYDAARRRTLVVLGNGTMTRYAYDRQSDRLSRIRAERYRRSEAHRHTYVPRGAPLHDVAHQHDLVGNIVETIERTPGCGIRANPGAPAISDPQLRALVADGDALLRRFGYDPLYRLVSASGRECVDRRPSAPWQDGPRCGFGVTNQHNAPDLTTGYRETFSYDPAGNLQRHARTGHATRHHTVAAGGNRLTGITAGDEHISYEHDATGNVVREGTSRHFHWDHSDRMKAFQTRAGAAAPSVHAQYFYDASGARVQKAVRRQGGEVTVTTYIDGVFEQHRRITPAGAVTAHTLVHVADGAQRVQTAREGTPHPDDQCPDVQYVLGDHLDDVVTVVDEAGGFINREEFTAYGETVFGSFAHKRYRFNGRERDEESGLAYHGARYYAPWLGRWTSCDPDAHAPPTAGASSPYGGLGCNPVNFTDHDGRSPKKPKEPKRPKSKSPSRSQLLIFRVMQIFGQDPEQKPVLDPPALVSEGDDAAKAREQAERDAEADARARRRPGAHGEPPSRESPTPDPTEPSPRRLHRATERHHPSEGRAGEAPRGRRRVGGTLGRALSAYDAIDAYREAGDVWAVLETVNPLPHATEAVVSGDSVGNTAMALMKDAYEMTPIATVTGFFLPQGESWYHSKMAEDARRNGWVLFCARCHAPGGALDPNGYYNQEIRRLEFEANFGEMSQPLLPRDRR